MEKNEEEEKRWKWRRRRRFTTTMQSSTAMQQSCTRSECNCFFPVNEEVDKVEEKGK